MATVKNFGLAGVAGNVQYGKGGGKLDWNGTLFSVTDKDGAAVAFQVATTPVNGDDVTSKTYVDSVATGLDFKDSAHSGTLANLAATYDNGTNDGFGATLTATVAGVFPALDAHYNSDLGTRILIKDQTDQTENGIYTVTTRGAGEELTKVVTVADVTGSLNDTYWELQDAGPVDYFVWYDVNGAGTEPVAGTGTAIPVALATDATAEDVRDATIIAINGAAINATAFLDETDIFYVVNDVTGVAANATDAGSTGFTITTSIDGTGSAVAWVLTRSTDADNTPSNEVSGGMFVFIEDGVTQANTSWVVSEPSGAAVIGTDDIVFIQFGGAGSVSGGDGINISGTVISHDTSGTANTAIATVDVMTFFDGSASGPLEHRSFGDMITDLNLLTSTNGGALTASEGVTLTAENLTLTIPSLTDGGEDLEGTDTIAVFDGTATLEYSFNDMTADLDIIHEVSSVGFVKVTTSTTGAQVYTPVDIVESTTARQQGAQVNNGGGASTSDVEIGIDILNLGGHTGNMVAGDLFIVDDTANNTKLTGQEVADGVATLLSIDESRIVDPLDADNFVDTDATTDSVTIGVKNFADAGSLAIAEFKHGAADGDCGFVFTNGADEVRIETTGETNCDIRLVPGGTGAVLIGDAGAALIQGDDETDLTVKGGNGAGAAGAGDLILEGGDGFGAFADGSVIIRPGTGGNTLESVCIQDEDEENVACFFGTAGTDLNSFSFTSSITAVDPTFGVVGEANVGLDIFTQGTGRIALDGNEFPTSTSAASSIFVVGQAGGSAGDISAVTATTAGTTKQLLQFDDNTDTFAWVDQTTIGGNAWDTIVTDGTTINADSVSDTLSILGGIGITTDGNDSTDTLTVTVALGELTNPGAIELGDEIVWVNGGVGTGDVRIVSEFLADLNIVNNLGGTGIAVQTAADTYTAVDVVASAAHDELGIVINNAPSGGSGLDIEVGLDIVGLTQEATIDGAADFIVVYDASTTFNRKVLVDDLVDASDQNIWTIIDADTGTNPAPVNNGDTLVLAGGLGIATVGSGTDTVTFNMDIDTNLTPVAEDMTATDEFAFFNSSGAVGNVGSLSGQRLADGVSTLLSLDDTAIFDSVNKSRVDTDQVGGAVTINTTNATDAATQLLATFQTTGTTTVTDANFLFQNEDSADTGGNDELQICAAGGATDIDIRLCPQGAGEVILGDAAANATLSASDGATGFDLTLNGGDGSSGNGGDIILTPGTGTGTDGEVCITDAAGVNITCFDGVASAVNSLQITNSATGGGPLFTAEGADTNIDLEFLPKGTGVLAIDTDVISATTYRDNLTDDSNDIPNTAYVAEQAAAVLSGAVSTVEFIVDLGDDNTTDSDVIPAGATVLRVSIDVTTLNTTSTLTIGTTGSPTAYADATTNDPSSADLYNVDLRSATVGTVRATVAAQTGAVGSATVVVEYRNA